MKLLGKEEGNILILAALCMTLLCSIMSLAVDVGQLFYTRHQLQTLADAAAMAAALEIPQCKSLGTPSSSCGIMQTAAKSAVTESGFASPTLVLQCASNSGSGLLMTLNNGPCELGSSDANNGSTNYAEVVMAENLSTTFARIFGVSSVKVSARAEAGKAPPVSQACLIVLGPPISSWSLQVNGGGSIGIASGSNCGIADNSSTTNTVDNNGSINVHTFTIVGTYQAGGGSTVSPSPTTGAAPVADPFAADIAAGTLSTPPQGTAQTTCGSYSVGAIGGTCTLNPGYYLNGVNFNGGTYTVTMNAGVYYMNGSFQPSNGVTVNGTAGVTLYMYNGTLTMNGGSTIELTPPSTGPTAGLVLWQPASNTNTMNLDGSTTSSFNGGIYVPGAVLQLNGGSTTLTYGMVVAKNVSVNGSIDLDCNAMTNVVCPSSGGGGANGSTTTALAE